MIKARLVQADGSPLTILGLSGENVTRLIAGEPIVFAASEVGLGDGRICLIYGHTENAMVAELEQQGALPPGTWAKMRAARGDG